MPTTFWNSWALWEKLCFVLACAIVLTIFVGCVKLIQKHYELRRHTAIAERKKEEQQQMEHFMSMTNDRVEGIPFGVRAIESGIEVDGVWISRSNTPVSSNPASPTSSIIGDQSPMRGHQHEDSTTKAIPTLEMPQPRYDHKGRPRPNSRSPSRSPEARSDAATFDSASHMAGPPEDLIKVRVRPTYQPRHSSHLRFSSGEILGRGIAVDNRTEHEAAIDNGKARHVSQASLDSNITSHHYVPRKSTHISGFLSPSYTSSNLSPVDDLPFTGHAYGELRPLGTHRQTQSAETGQLSPRIRASVASTDWTSVYSLPGDRDISTKHGQPQASNDARKNPDHTTEATEQLVEPPSFQSFIDSDPLSTKRQLMPVLPNTEMLELEEKSQPLKSTDANRQAKPSDVIRKVNSGFEILRPGTLGPRRQSSDTSDSGNKQTPKMTYRKPRAESFSTRGSRFSEEV